MDGCLESSASASKSVVRLRRGKKLQEAFGAIRIDRVRTIRPSQWIAGGWSVQQKLRNGKLKVRSVLQVISRSIYSAHLRPTFFSTPLCNNHPLSFNLSRPRPYPE